MTLHTMYVNQVDSFFFFFNDTATTEIYTLSLHDALPIWVDWPFEGGFHCWVGLDTVLKKDHLAINPFVGVHVVPIMKFYTALECRRYSRTVSTYALDMGKLKSYGPVFRFTRHSDVDAVVARLVRLY